MKRLALNINGDMTYCSSPDHLVGKGRCNHIPDMIQKENESEDAFKSRVFEYMKEEEIKPNIMPKNITTISKSYEKLCKSKDFDKKVNGYIFMNMYSTRLRHILEVMDDEERIFVRKEIEIPNKEELEELRKKYSNEEYLKAYKEMKLENEDWFEYREVMKTFYPSDEIKGNISLVENQLNETFKNNRDIEALKIVYQESLKIDKIVKETKEKIKNNPKGKSKKQYPKEEFKDNINKRINLLRNIYKYISDSDLESMCSKQIITKYTKRRNIKFE